MEVPVAIIQLKRGREKPVNNRHPWIFSGAVQSISGGEPSPGDLVDVVDFSGQWLATAYYNPNSQIRARILSWRRDEAIDEDFWRGKLLKATGFRDVINLEPGTTAYRLINAESDELPGLIVDKYGDFLVFQALTAGIDSRKEIIVSLLDDILSPRGIIERSDVPVRNKEGLKSISGLRAGQGPPEVIIVKENKFRFEVNLYRGHKTGLYLDQRDNRIAVCRPELVNGLTVLNLFSYTGGFAIYAAAAGAKQITNVDTSSSALETARKNIALNCWERPQDEYIIGDAFQILRQFRDEGREFDMIILDPPKFAAKKSEVTGATRGYKDINLHALNLLSENGWLATFSCSGLIQRELFQKILFGAAIDARRNVQIVRTLSQASDHPILLSFPESQYLKGFLCRVL